MRRNKISRRRLLASVTAVGAVRFLPKIAASTGGRRILTLYFDKAVGAMRASDNFVPS